MLRKKPKMKRDKKKAQDEENPPDTPETGYRRRRDPSDNFSKLKSYNAISLIA
ncbi:hypothetical protein YC2023_083022 [Brassica napus]